MLGIRTVVVLASLAMVTAVVAEDPPTQLVKPSAWSVLGARATAGLHTVRLPAGLIERVLVDRERRTGSTEPSSFIRQSAARTDWHVGLGAQVLETSKDGKRVFQLQKAI